MKLVNQDYYNKVVNEDTEEQVLVVGGSGKGKTLLAERMIYSYYKRGWKIIVASDQKDLLEMGFMTFPPEIMKPYQKKALKFEGQEPTRIPVKIFHPFTFDIPDNKIPETEFITFPIKEMGDDEFNLLLESSDDRTTRELLIQAREQLHHNEGLWNFMKKVEELTERKTKKKGSQEVKLPDPDRFGLKGVSGGDVKNLDSIERAFHRFQKHLFLTPENHPLNLNWKKQVFNNQEEVSIFTTRYIQKDKKTKDFFILMLLNQLVQHSHESDEKILVVLDEIKDLAPSKTTGYNQVLADNIAKHLNTNFRARGIGSISTSQSFSGINKTLLRENCWTITLFMYIDSEKDLRTLRDTYGFTTDHIDKVQELDRNEFFARGVKYASIKDYDLPQKALMPPYPHAEPKYQFDELYKKYFPEKMQRYKELKKRERELKRSWISEIMEQAKQKQKRAEEKKAELEEAKRREEKLKKELEKKKEQEKQRRQQEIEERNAEIVRKYEDGATQTELAEEYEMTQPGIRHILVQAEVLK